MLLSMPVNSPTYYVIYDGRCNLCVNLVRVLESLDQGMRFCYAPMQAEETLAALGVTPADCELGMILIDAASPDQRWQGSAAAEEIGRILPMGAVFVEAYRRMPGVKPTGDRLYEQVRDNRYQWFGKRDRLYESAYPLCEADVCARAFDATAPSADA